MLLLNTYRASTAPPDFTLSDLENFKVVPTMYKEACAGACVYPITCQANTGFKLIHDNFIASK